MDDAHAMILVANLNIRMSGILYMYRIFYFFGASLKFHSMFHENNDKY